MDEASKKRKERLEQLKKRKLESAGGDDSVRYITPASHLFSPTPYRKATPSTRGVPAPLASS
jgi:hypothetical protein